MTTAPATLPDDAGVPWPSDPRALDGNAAAGVLAELFAAEMTTAVAACAGCGTSGAVATLLLYAHGMGLILRCPACGAAVLRLARRRGGGYRMDLRGAATLDVGGEGRASV